MKKFLSILASSFFICTFIFYFFKPSPILTQVPLQQGYYNLLGKPVGLNKPKIPGIYLLVQGKKTKKIIVPPPEAEKNP